MLEHHPNVTIMSISKCSKQPNEFAGFIITVTRSSPSSQNSPPPGHGLLSAPPPAHLKTNNRGPWRRCLLTSASAGAPPLCCKRQTFCWTWQQPFRPLRASRCLLSAPAAAVAFLTASWLWRSWSAWSSPSWLEMWSPWPSLCKQGNPEHRRDTWKVNESVS